MKIMRRESRISRRHSKAREASIVLASGDAGSKSPTQSSRSSDMKWTTPTAKVLRFGMEINCYVANR